MVLGVSASLVAADAILLAHAALVAFIVLGLPLIWVGRAAGWSCVRSRALRTCHLAAMGVVVLESLVGTICPLTVWEDALRAAAGGEQAYAGSFVREWTYRILFYDFDERVFIATYLLLFALIVLTYRLVPPDRPGTKG